MFIKMAGSVLIPYALLMCIVLLDLHGVHAIKCYVCESSQEGCGDPFNDKTITAKECPSTDSDSCLKVKTTYNGGTNFCILSATN